MSGAAAAARRRGPSTPNRSASCLVMVMVTFSATPRCATKPFAAAVLRDVADARALGGVAPAGRDAPRRAAGPRRRVLASAPAITRPMVATPALSRPVTPTTSPACTRSDTPDRRPRAESEVRSVDREHHVLAAGSAVAAGGRATGCAGAARPPDRSTAGGLTTPPTIAATRSSLAEAGRRRGQHQLAVAQHGDVLADLEDLFQVMGDVEDGDAAGGELAHPVEQPRGRPRARGRRWARRAARTGRRGPAPGRSRRSAAARPTGPGTGVSGAMSKPHSPMMARGPAAHRPPADQPPGWLPRKTFSATDRSRHDHRVLEDRGDPLAPAGDVAHAGRGLAAEPHRARVRLDEAGQDRDEGRLARAVAADQARGTARRSIDRLTPRRARVVPNRFSTPVTSTSAWPLEVIALIRSGGARRPRQGRRPPGGVTDEARTRRRRRRGPGRTRCPTGVASRDRGRGERGRAGRRPGWSASALVGGLGHERRDDRVGQVGVARGR